MESTYLDLLRPTKLWSRREVLSKPSPVPRSPGAYAWYFRAIPPGVPTEGCLSQDDLTLLYVGISPRSPASNGRVPSGQTLLTRLRTHMQGNAEGSTLRLAIGCLLSEQLGIMLRRVRSKDSVSESTAFRYTFTRDGEASLNEWLNRYAFVAWMVDGESWTVEDKLIRSVSLPLNLAQNSHRPFYVILSDIKRRAKERANELPVAWE